MPPLTSQLPFFIAPLADALESIEGWIKRENAVRVIAATARMSELRQNDLPEHVRVTKRPLKGKRIVTRNARHFKQTRLRVAYYPEAQMNETAIPALLCVVSGAARIYAGNYILHCQPGDFVLIPPMVPKGDLLSHAINDRQETISDVLYIYPGRLLGEGLECWLSHSQGKTIISNAQLGAALLRNEFLSSLFTQLCTEIRNSSQSELTFLLTRSLMLFLLREFEEDRAVLPDIKRLDIKTNKTEAPIQYAIAYLKANLNTPLSIEGMARETALSTTSFKQSFRQATGQSFYQYLTVARMEFAEKLLYGTDLTIQDIAKSVGLSPSRLNRHFHRKHSCSPGEYRRKK